MAKEPERNHRGDSEKSTNLSESRKPSRPAVEKRPATPSSTKKK